ncbi:uncharacterized protein N7459_001715 [Penicillium hispanicum]|uniref:uncharacterized protein n=1 Tax=Penicillium hispanicum TaxID=1080232 RepID=UPI002541291A|nr:uncharacterized protein N7459_001715 [Penicillium hispanicum]KAJ5595507.1 hypothetical protein N7459_001715 [Penicillium hispanicum]
MAPVTLDTLPSEIQCAIFRLLDPPGLISTSQTCSRFRKIISPSRLHFLERLLVLECQEKEGGVTPIFSARTSRFDPDWSSAEWEAMRWACTGCLRLLPHTAFDNHSLLRLRYRKPIPGSPAADLHTSWEPTRRGVPWPSRHRRRQEPFERTAEEKKIRRRYGIAVSYSWNRPRYLDAPDNKLTDFQELGMEAFAGMTHREYVELEDAEWKHKMDSEARAIELERCGFKRRLRRCNECRYQRGEIQSRIDSVAGTPKVPIARGRQLNVATAVDRYFPGISDVLEHQRPAGNPPMFRVYCVDDHDKLWTTYMVRCPRCATWQANRAFCFGGAAPQWVPMPHEETFLAGLEEPDYARITGSVMDGLRCNHCYVQDHGREQFGKKFVQWVKFIVAQQRDRLESHLGFGWRPILNASRTCPQQWQREVADIVSGPRDIAQRERSGSHDGLTDADIALYHERYHQWMELRGQMLKQGKAGWINEDSWVGTWTHEYETMEAHWLWLKGIEAEVDGKVEALVDWVLTR